MADRGCVFEGGEVVKLACGTVRQELTAKDRANIKRWRAEGKIWLAKRAHLTKWHPWFAWFPVKLADYDCRWFEWVQRRIEYYEGVAPMERWRYYREISAVDTPESDSP
jgi:hypothetical protein